MGGAELQHENETRGDRLAPHGMKGKAAAPLRHSARLFFLQSEFSHMSEAIERIVGTYVKLRNRKVLEDMKVHRQRLATELKSVHGAFDLGLSIKQLDDEIAVIEAGLTMLNTAAAA